VKPGPDAPARNLQRASYEQMLRQEEGERGGRYSFGYGPVGFGRSEQGRQHALATAKILSDIDPDFASALTLMWCPEPPFTKTSKPAASSFLPFSVTRRIGNDHRPCRFQPCYFTSNHASNYLPSSPPAQDKEAVIRLIHQVIGFSGQIPIAAEFLRGL